MRKLILVLGSFAFAAPLFAAASDPLTPTMDQSVTLERIIAAIGPIIILSTQILDGLALLGFFWGLAMFIWNAGNEKKREEGRHVMIWGILALFVLLSVTGIVYTLQYTFGLAGHTSIVPPSAFEGNY